MAAGDEAVEVASESDVGFWLVSLGNSTLKCSVELEITVFCLDCVALIEVLAEEDETFAGDEFIPLCWLGLDESDSLLVLEAVERFFTGQ